jgi:DNA-binding transcriptional regulator YiaG
MAQHTSQVGFNHFEERFSPRKLIPVNQKTLGDYLLLKRMEASLSQPEVAQKAGVSVRTVRKLEYGNACPNEDHWQVLTHILLLDSTFQKVKTHCWSHVLDFTHSH